MTCRVITGGSGVTLLCRIREEAASLATALWAAAWSADSAAAGAAALAVTGVVIFTLFVTGYQVRESREHGRSGRPLPPGTAR